MRLRLFIDGERDARDHSIRPAVFYGREWENVLETSDIDTLGEEILIL